MSIVKAINELSGKEAVTIEDAIRNVDISGGGDKGYECTESRQTLTEESITTQQGQAPYASIGLSYNTLIDADVLKVTFNGTEYTCEKHVMGNANIYGGFSQSGPDFSEYPFAVMSSPNGYGSMNVIYTETEGTYSIKIEAVDMTVETTPCFEMAVKSVAGNALFVVHFTNESGSWFADKSWNDAKQAIVSGVPAIGVVEKHDDEYATEYTTMPLIHSGNIITGNTVTVPNASNPTLFSTRIEWTESGAVIYNEGSYSLA